MQNSTIEMSLLDSEEREMVEAVWNMIPEQDRMAISQDDILFVLDEMDEYLLSVGLAKEDEQSGEIIYENGEVDETEQLNYILKAAQDDRRQLTSAQVQIIQDAEMQYGIEQGWYEDEE